MIATTTLIQIQEKFLLLCTAKFRLMSVPLLSEIEAHVLRTRCTVVFAIIISNMN